MQRMIHKNIWIFDIGKLLGILWCVCRTKHLEIVLALRQDQIITIISVKFETNLEMYIKVSEI